MELRDGGARWFAECLEMKNPRQNVWFSHMEPSKIGSDLAKANFNADASANSNANAIWSDFCFRFTKISSPLEREAHFWKPTLSNQSSKIHFLEHWKLQMRTHWAIFLVLIALKLFSAPFPLQSPIQILKKSWQNVWFLHREPSKIGSDLANANLNANASANSNANAIWSDCCLRLGPFEAMFASAWVRFRLVFRPLGLCKCKCRCTCKCTCSDATVDPKCPKVNPK